MYAPLPAAPQDNPAPGPPVFRPGPKGTAMNPIDGTWKFRRTDGKMTGLIRLSGHGQRTRIDILLNK